MKDMWYVDLVDNDKEVCITSMVVFATDELQAIENFKESYMGEIDETYMIYKCEKKGDQ